MNSREWKNRDLSLAVKFAALAYIVRHGPRFGERNLGLVRSGRLASLLHDIERATFRRNHAIKPVQPRLDTEHGNWPSHRAATPRRPIEKTEPRADIRLAGPDRVSADRPGQLVGAIPWMFTRPQDTTMTHVWRMVSPLLRRPCIDPLCTRGPIGQTSSFIPKRTKRVHAYHITIKRTPKPINTARMTTPTTGFQLYAPGRSSGSPSTFLRCMCFCRAKFVQAAQSEAASTANVSH